MKDPIKRAVIGVCAAVLLAAGCGRPAQTSNEITVWHWLTDREEALEALAWQYEQQTGVHVELALFAPPDAYIHKVFAAAQADVLPDIYGVLKEKTVLASFIKAGYVMDLGADLRADDGVWEKSLFAKALDHYRFVEGNVDGVAPGVYGIPFDVSNVQMIYNKALLRKAGIAAPPATFNEFLAAANALKRVGIAPFVTGFGELWIVDCFASNYAHNIMGEDKVMATFRGEVPYTDPDWVAVFTVFQTLARRGVFIDGIVTKGNKYAEQDFALERAAFSFDGSWAVNIYRSMNPALDYGVQPLPAIYSKSPMRVWGGAGSAFVVNARSSRKEQAVAFLKWLTAQPQQAYLARATNNLPANREAGAGVAKELGDFARVMDNVTHPRIWELNEDPLVVEAFDRGIQAIIIGEKTPREVAKEVQQVKARQMGKIKRP